MYICPPCTLAAGKQPLGGGGAERKYAKSLAKLVEQQCCIHERTKQNQRKAKYVRLRCTISMTTVVSEIARA